MSGTTAGSVDSAPTNTTPTTPAVGSGGGDTTPGSGVAPDSSSGSPDSDTPAEDTTDTSAGADDSTDDGVSVTDDQGAGDTDDEDDATDPTCAAPRIQCSAACIDPLSDPRHCGSCGTACPPGSSCLNGTCDDSISTTDDESSTDDGTADDPVGQDPNLEGESASSNAYPCDGDSTGYDAVVSESGGTWTANNGANSVYSGSDMRSAIQAAIDSLSAGRTDKESVLVLGSGTIDAGSRVNMKSHTLLNVCGTIDVVGSPSGDNAPVYGRGVTNVEVPNISITGNPAYGIFFRESHDLTFGHVELRVTGGLGVRIDSGPNYSGRGSNLRIDYAYVEGTSNHAVETYGIDGIQIGTVIARDVGYSGLLLNDSTDAEVGLVDGDNVAAGQGYAVFRMANRNGRVGGDYPANIHVRRVVARGGGRGIFCVSESGGAVIDHIDIENTGNNSVLLENCYNVTIGNPDEQSRVVNSGELRISARTDEFENSRDITFQNIAVSGTNVRESPCADGSTWLDIDSDGSIDVCN